MTAVKWRLIGSTGKSEYRKKRKRENKTRVAFGGLFGATLLMDGKCAFPIRARFPLLVSNNRIGLKFNHRSMQKPF